MTRIQPAQVPATCSQQTPVTITRLSLNQTYSNSGPNHAIQPYSTHVATLLRSQKITQPTELTLLTNPIWYKYVHTSLLFWCLTPLRRNPAVDMPSPQNPMAKVLMPSIYARV
ncbi:hypothetical protein M404DRAFT_1001422 [Pisolithus tinctorius Marx 270]|uniref:Uncharacterized protein n=1 Tax=Pisolithus tinctorius Marx 270 TaxID=870435 RepID=A0A0C3P7A3_PISTI|nr:hypothetical protein M404DRAFT_1001422 [Pisolithus tinctorius Marx 270]